MTQLSRVEGKECVVEAKPVRRGFLRKGGGRHDPEDFEVITVMVMVVIGMGMVLVMMMRKFQGLEDLGLPRSLYTSIIQPPK